MKPAATSRLTRASHYALLLVGALTLVLATKDETLLVPGIVISWVGAMMVFTFTSPRPEEPTAPAPRSPELLANYRALLEQAERQLLAGKDPRTVGAWVRDNRVQLELDALAYEAMHTHIEDVVLKVHERRTLTSADPLWGQIDQAAGFVREVRR